MDTTPVLQLPILQAADYANVALYLQTLAEAVEAQAALIDDDVTSAHAREAAVMNFGNLGSVAASPVYYDVWQNASSLYWSSGAVTDPNDFWAPTGSGPFISGQFSPFSGPGIWHLMWTMEVDPDGGITANSMRSGVANLLRGQGTEWEVVQRIGEQRMYETDTQFGFTQLGGEGTFVVGDDFERMRLSLAFQHENAASDMTVNGGWLALRRVGTDDVIEVR